MKEQIKELALRSGFKLKEQPDGSMDLNPYVYEFANELMKHQTVRVYSDLANECSKRANAINPVSAFKVGDIVVCDEPNGMALTKGLHYEVLAVDGSKIEVEDDFGDEYFYDKDEVAFTLYEVQDD